MNRIVNDVSYNLCAFGTALEIPLQVYHNTVKEFLDSPEKGKMQETAFRVAVFLLAPAAYPLFGTLKLMGHLLEKIGILLATAYLDPDRELKINIKELRQEALEGWQDKAIALIRKNRFDNMKREIRRLRMVGALNKIKEGKVDHALKKVYVNHPSCAKYQQAKVQLGRALEIKEIYGATHDVFIHAQSTKWLIFSHLIKEFTRAFYPEKDLRNYKFLRAPCNTVEGGLFDSLFTSKIFFYRKTPGNAKEYIESKWWINDSNNNEREKLLSVDAFFYNYQKYESSLYFMINNDNIFNNQDAIQNFSRKVIRHFHPSIKADALNQHTERIVKAAFQKAECGNLFVICLPKQQSDKISYRAHPFGTPCKCHQEKQNRGILNKLQEEEVIDNTTRCHTGILIPPIPQYRLFTPLLNPGDGKRIYLLTPFDKKVRQHIKAEVKKIVNDVYASLKSHGNNSNPPAVE